MEIFESEFGMTLALVLVVGSMVTVAGLQIGLCIRSKSLLVRLIPVFVCLGLVLLSILMPDGQLSVVLTACSVLLLLFAGVGWVVARMILKNSR